MEFDTQRELLIYLGKNPNDRSLVSRMIIRGEVEKKNGKYYLKKKDTIIDALVKELEMYKQCYEKNAEDYNELLEEYNKLSSEKKSSKNTTVEGSDLDYQIQENERLEGEKKEMIEGLKKAFFYYAKGISWDYFKSKVGLSELLEDIDIE